MSKALATINELKIRGGTIHHPPKDEIRAINYYRDELEATLNRFEAFKEKTNMIIERGKQQEYLIQFRKMLSGHCIVKNRNITIIQCRYIIKNKECKFHNECRIRKEILTLIIL